MPKKTNPNLSQERLRDVLNYDPNEGVFTWKIRVARNTKVGAKAGSVGPKGYRYIRIDSADFLAQRLAWFWVHGVWPRLLRFQNGNTDDFKIDNLCEGFYLTTKYDYRTAEGRAQYNKEYRDARPGIFRNTHLQRNFGIDLAEYQRMFVEQNGVCAICDRPETRQRRGTLRWLAVDHNHETGAVRGLLCSDCNVMLGYAQDSESRMARAIEYLRRHADPVEGTNVIKLSTRERA